MHVFTCGALLMLARSIPAARNRLIFSRRPSWWQILHETHWSFWCLAVSFLTNVLLLPHLTLVTLRSSYSENLLFCGLAFIAFEIWFYFTHRLFHTRALYKIHHVHHRYEVPTPFSSHAFSPIEQTVLNSGVIAFAIVYGYFHPVPAYGLQLHVWLVYVLNLVGHSNLEFVPAKTLNTHWIFNWIATPSYHSAHHKDSGSRFALFFVFLDRWFKTGQRIASPAESENLSL